MRYLLLLILLLPVRADAIILVGFGGCGTGTNILGTDTVGASTLNGSVSNTTVRFNEFVASASGPICTGEIYFNDSATEDVKMLVYNSSHTLIATSSPISSFVGGQWTVFTFDGTVSLTSGQTYLLGWIHNGTNYEGDIRNTGTDDPNAMQFKVDGSYASPPTDVSGHAAIDSTGGIGSMRIKN